MLNADKKILLNETEYLTWLFREFINKTVGFIPGDIYMIPRDDKPNGYDIEDFDLVFEGPDGQQCKLFYTTRYMNLTDARVLVVDNDVVFCLTDDEYAVFAPWRTLGTIDAYIDHIEICVDIYKSARDSKARNIRESVMELVKGHIQEAYTYLNNDAFYKDHDNDNMTAPLLNTAFIDEDLYPYPTEVVILKDQIFTDKLIRLAYGLN